jgi:hypothetical protein
MFHYLVVVPGKGQFAVEEVSGRLHHRALHLFRLLAVSFDCVLEPLPRRLEPVIAGGCDLVLLLPASPMDSLATHLFQGFVEAALQALEGDDRLSLPKKEVALALSDQLSVPPADQLLGLIRVEGPQVEWLPGTSRRRTPGKRLLGLWRPVAKEPVYAGPTGTVFPRKSGPGQVEDEGG